jgi:hypothetical protein
MNNDTDYIQLLNKNGTIIEEVAYAEKYHNSLLLDFKGIALERRSVSNSGLNKDNWMSACANNDFGSPGLQNCASQNNSIIDSSIDWLLYPKMLMPNGDGIDDYLIIKPNFDPNNTIVEVKIIDQAGQVIKEVCSPQTISNQEWLIWNGLTADCKVGPTAIYFTWIRYGELGKKTKTTLLPFYLKAL